MEASCPLPLKLHTCFVPFAVDTVSRNVLAKSESFASLEQANSQYRNMKESG